MDLLKNKAVINDTSDEMIAIFGNKIPQLVKNVNKWTTRDYILFKTESYRISALEEIPQVNIALGKSGPLQSLIKI